LKCAIPLMKGDGDEMWLERKEIASRVVTQ
jgi:hypothetical protein